MNDGGPRNNAALIIGVASLALSAATLWEKLNDHAAEMRDRIVRVEDKSGELDRRLDRIEQWMGRK